MNAGRGRAANESASVEARILETARAHVRKFGARRTTVVGVAEELGMAHATIYRYYASKSALLEAVTGSWLRPLEERLREAVDGADPAHDKLERMLIAIHSAYRATLDADPSLFELLVESLEKGRASARRHRGRVQAEIQRVVEEGLAGGAFAMADRRRAMALIFDAAHRFIHPSAMRLDRDITAAALSERFETLIRLILRALRSGRA